MKRVKKIGLKWLLPFFIALAFLRPFSGAAQDETDDFSWLKLIPPGYCLDSWSFEETNWDSDFGFAPLSYSNIVQVPDWDGNALQVDTTNGAWLTYNIVENAPGYGEYTNLTLDAGSIEFWFIANWESADTNFYGDGCGDWGRLLDVGTWATNKDCGWWSLYLNPGGTGIYFSSGTNGVRTNYLNAPISWDWNTWHAVVLTYSQSNTFLYLDGQLAASGSGVCYVPSGDILTNGFAIGSDFATGVQQAHGQFDDLSTYNYQLSAEDISNDYAEVSSELPGGFHAMDDSGLFPGGGGTNGGGGGQFYGAPGSPPDYGSNLWVALLGTTNNVLSLMETNTMSDVLYELQGCTNLVSLNWISFGFVSGSELTNWTPALAPVENGSAMYYRVRSWQDIGGIPLWWFLAYFGQDTNVDANAFSPSGDGWTLLQCYEAGLNPTNWITPPAPQGLSVTSFNSTNHTATLSWMLSAGPVLAYILQTPGGTNIVGSNVDSYADSSSSSSASYSIQAIYAGGNSAWSPSVSVEDFLNQQGSGVSSLQNVALAAFVPGPSGLTYLAVGGIPSNTVTVQLEFIDSSPDRGPTVTYDISMNAITNGLYQFPPSWNPPSDEGPGGPYFYAGFIQAIDVNSNASSLMLFSSWLGDLYEPWNWSVPYFDGREQIKQNLIFLLREPIGTNAFACGGSVSIAEPASYAYASYYDTLTPGFFAGAQATNALDEFLPFDDNYFYRNFVFSEADADTNGMVTNGIDMDEGGDGYYGLTASSLTYQFQEPPEETNIPALLATNATQWLICSPIQLSYGDYTSGVFFDLSDMGITYYFDENDVDVDFSMGDNAVSYFGLPIQSVDMTYIPGGSDDSREGNYETNLFAPNTTFQVDYQPSSYPDFYVQAAQPHFQTGEYNFWSTGPAEFIYDYPNWGNAGSPLPGNSTFTTTNQSDVLITSIGYLGFQVAGYAKLAVTNSVYSGVYGYLGQYFTNAYQIDNNGNVTNATGVLSPYGQFFATEPGQAALVTMPDPDTGLQGTGVVDVIALNVDANHDGTMDFSFTGPDFVGPNNPYQFWVNDDQDAGDDTGSGIPGQPAPLADGQCPSGYDDNYQSVYRIHGTRDLVDYFPVYVNIGSLFESNALSAGISYTDTNWQFVLSQEDGALRFAYTDLTPLNYTNYLKDITTASNLADSPVMMPIVNTIPATGVALTSEFLSGIVTNNGGIILVEAWTNTTQPLVLTIYHGTNQIAQTSLYLSISEVEQMFRSKTIMLNTEPGEVPDRLTVADVPNEPPTNDKNFIFLHGYNVNVTQARGWDSDYFKRLYWSGSHAKFYGVTWEGADSQYGDTVTIDLQTNIVNAFNTAPLLNTFLNSLSGTNIVAAHSLGNIVVLSALNDYSNQTINTYFMIDAAVPIEALQGNATPDANMYYPDWIPYADKLNANHWWQLWPTNDSRYALTWNNRLANLQNANVYNFYSSGEEVLREYTGGYPPSELEGALDQVEYYLVTTMLNAGLPTGDYTWAWQEMLKGRGEFDWVFSSTHGGWKFNTNAPYSFVTNGVITQIPDSQATLTPNSQLQTNAFFDVTSPQFGNADLALFGSSGSSYAQANQNRILSDAIPALTLPVGANPVSLLNTEFGGQHNFNMSTNTFENGWPAVRLQNGTEGNNWHHSDCRQVAYPFTHQLFDDIVTFGGLQ